MRFFCNTKETNFCAQALRSAFLCVNDLVAAFMTDWGVWYLMPVRWKNLRKRVCVIGKLNFFLRMCTRSRNDKKRFSSSEFCKYYSTSGGKGNGVRPGCFPGATVCLRMKPSTMLIQVFRAKPVTLEMSYQANPALLKFTTSYLCYIVVGLRMRLGSTIF